MKVLAILGLFVAAAMSQEILDVTCGQDAITARFEKKVADSANYNMADLHFSDPECLFDEEEEDYFVKRIDPLTSCGTETTVNDTHVTFTNSISTGDIETGISYPHGIIMGQPENQQLISVKLECTYEIDLRVSANFLPNITYIYIDIPDAIEVGVFKVGMAIYRTGAYREPYTEPSPILQPEETVFVGISMIGDTSADAFLLIKKCWATVYEDPDSDPFYPLIEDQCAITDAAQGTVRVTQNGVGHQALWQTEVFRFVGEGEEFKAVWLHCDVTICFTNACEPTCAGRRRRKRRSAFDNTEHVVSFGPLNKMTIHYDGDLGVAHVIVKNETMTEIDTAPRVPKEDTSLDKSTLLIIIGALAAFCLLCLSMALVIVLMRMKRNNDNAGVTTTGTINKGFSI